MNNVKKGFCQDCAYFEPFKCHFNAPVHVDTEDWCRNFISRGDGQHVDLPHPPHPPHHYTEDPTDEELEKWEEEKQKYACPNCHRIVDELKRHTLTEKIGNIVNEDVNLYVSKVVCKFCKKK
jgi:hypothetical protein